VLRKSGSVYVREPGGKNPIRAQAQLLEFVRQNGETKASAAARLELAERVRQLLHTDSDPPDVSGQTHTACWVVIGTPQVLPVDLATRALRESAVRAATERLVGVLETNTIRPWSDLSQQGQRGRRS
jgi:hypothetical protein